MKFRLLIALVVVLALVLGGGLFAQADEDEPNCWWFSYAVSVMGTSVIKIPNRCIPCFGVCGSLPPPPTIGKKKGSSASSPSY